MNILNQALMENQSGEVNEFNHYKYKMMNIHGAKHDLEETTTE